MYVDNDRDHEDASNDPEPDPFDRQAELVEPDDVSRAEKHSTL